MILSASWLAAKYYLDRYLAIDSVSVDNTHYLTAATATPAELGKVRQAELTSRRALTISCQFKLVKPDALSSNELRYQNLFQTAQGNDGVRLEFIISPPALGLEWGLVFATEQGGVIGLPLGPFTSYDKWHSLEIETIARRVRVRLDGKTIHDADAPGLIYATSDIVVGSGFSKTRPFLGEIRHFSLKTFQDSPTLRGLGQLLHNLVPIFIALGFLLHLVALRGDSPKGSIRRLLVACGIALFVFHYASLKALLVPMPAIEYLNECLFAVTVLLLIEASGGLIARLHWIVRLVFTSTVTAVTHLVLAILSLIFFYWRKTDDSFERQAAQPNFDEIGAIYQSNLMEAAGYLLTGFTSSELFFSLGVPMLAAVIAGRLAWSAPSSPPPWRQLALIAGLALTMGFATNWSHSMSGVFKLAIQQLQAKAGEFDAFIALRKNASARMKIQAAKDNRGETYVLVIGESANPAHLGAYGYFRPTTPWLSAKATDPGWLLFQNAYASYCHTVPSLLMALTSANQYNKTNDFEAPSIIDVFKVAGFKTYWLSEQGVSWTDNPLNALASESDKFSLVRPVGRIPALLDETLASIDPKQNNLIVLHLIGSHAPYAARVPTKYQPDFLQQKHDLAYLNKGRPSFVTDELNPYDASIHYTDWTLSEIARVLQGRISQTNAFIYVSDHGEDVLGGKAHNASLFTYSMARVPLVISASPSWQARYPGKFSLLKQRLDRVFTLDLLFELMTGLADINTPLREPKFDFTSPDYGIDVQNAVTMSPSSTLQKQLYPEAKAHRIADDPWLIAKQNIAFLRQRYGDKFLGVNADKHLAPFNGLRLGLSGVEINITVPNMTIGHYPDEVSEVQLDQYLGGKPFSEFHKIWFDTKLVAGRKLTDCLSAFEEIDRRHHVKQRAILESWEAGLSQFSDNGWKTSYYIHEKIWPELNSQNKETLNIVAKKIADRVVLEKAKAVSFFAKDYGFVKEYLEPLLPVNVVYLTWSLQVPSPALPPITSPAFQELALSNPIVNDPRVDTILIGAVDIN